MKISGANVLPPVVPSPATRGAGRKGGSPELEVAPAPAATSPAPAPETDAPAEPKPHGLVRAAEHSNRSDVAALRQWINHPELRDSLPVPDITAEHKGRGFERAVAAYQAVAPPAPPADPVVTDPDPIVTDPDPVVTDPVVTDPVLTDPVLTDPVVTDPVVTDPVLTDPDPIVTDPVVTDPVVVPDPVDPGGVVVDEGTVIDLLPPPEGEPVE